MFRIRTCITLGAMLILGACGSAGSNSGFQPAGILETRAGDSRVVGWDMLDPSEQLTQGAAPAESSPNLCDDAGNCVTHR